MAQVKASVARLRRQQVIVRRQPCELLTAGGDVVSFQLGSVHERVRETIDIDIRQLKSPKNWPTTMMRELFRMSDNVDNCKSVLKSNEMLLKEFISIVCVIDENDLDVAWDMIGQSLAQMSYDQKSNANKKRASEARRSQASTTDGNANTIASSNPAANRTSPSSRIDLEIQMLHSEGFR